VIGLKKAREAIEDAGDRVSTGLVVVAVVALAAIALATVALVVTLRDS
jgi:hypothetical protein